MGMISRLYDNVFSVAAAKRSRDAQAKRDEKARKRLEKLNNHRVANKKKPKQAIKIKREFDRSGRPIYTPGMGKEFYRTRAWLDVRYAVLQKHGAKCQCCGATRSDDVRIHVDHIRPRHRFPHLELEAANLQVLCEQCNIGKGARYERDWRSDGASTRPSINSAVSSD